MSKRVTLTDTELHYILQEIYEDLKRISGYSNVTFEKEGLENLKQKLEEKDA